jgi:hypothetical protein
MNIYKYKLDKDIVEMPNGARILHVGIQSGDLYAWALVNPEAVKIPTLRVIGTGHPIPDSEHLDVFMGTHLLYDGSLVLHVFTLKVN